MHQDTLDILVTFARKSATLYLWVDTWISPRIIKIYLDAGMSHILAIFFPGTKSIDNLMFQENGVKYRVLKLKKEKGANGCPSEKKMSKKCKTKKSIKKRDKKQKQNKKGN